MNDVKHSIIYSSYHIIYSSYRQESEQNRQNVGNLTHVFFEALVYTYAHKMIEVVSSADRTYGESK